MNLTQLLMPVWNWTHWAFSGRRLMVIGGVIILCIALGRVFGRYPFLWNQLWGSASQSTQPRERLQVGDQILHVEVVRTPAAIEQGLSDRAELGADGMLFVLPHRSSPSFWMLRMHFALDMIWLDQDRIVQIDTNVPPPSETDGIPTVVQPRQPVTAVLEVPAGTARSVGWKVGTKWQLLEQPVTDR